MATSSSTRPGPRVRRATTMGPASENLHTSRHRHLIDHLASAQQERSERVVDDVKCIRATTKR